MITMTEAAAAKIRLMADEHEMTEHGVRVMVVGGGCSGLSYDMDFESEEKEGGRRRRVVREPVDGFDGQRFRIGRSELDDQGRRDGVEARDGPV